MNDLRFIALSGKRGEGKFAIVDECDFERVTSRFSWNYDSRGYASSSTHKEERRMAMVRGKLKPIKKQRSVFLHREVFGEFVWHDRQEVDHSNCVRLDCRRSNLRIATYSQNTANKILKPNPSTGFRGVYQKHRRFHARIGRVENEDNHIGTFATKEEAARAYDRAAINRWGDFARTNFPRSDYEVQS